MINESLNRRCSASLVHGMNAPKCFEPRPENIQHLQFTRTVQQPRVTRRPRGHLGRRRRRVQNIPRARIYKARGVVRKSYACTRRHRTNTHVRMKKSACAPLQKSAYRYKRLDENDPTTTTTPLQIGGIKSEGTRGTHRREQRTERCQGNNTYNKFARTQLTAVENFHKMHTTVTKLCRL